MASDATRQTPVGSRPGGTGWSTGINAVVGGVVGIVLSFVPLSTLLGGAVAGYLEGGTAEAGLKVGALAGLVMLVPFLLFGSVAVFMMGVAGAPGAFGLFAVAILVVGALYTVGLGALGGALGVYLDQEL